MKKTLFATHWTGGGVWGLKQLVQADYIERQTGMSMAELSDINISSSIGALAGNCLLIPDAQDPSKPKFKAGDIIEPFKDCAAQLFGPHGILDHYTEAVKYDIGNLIASTPGYVKPVLARFLRNPSANIHKPHHILGDFLNHHIGDIKLNNLMKSSIVYAHHMEKTSRVCFATLKGNMFDADKWMNSVLPNHGDHHTLKDVIMATTAAPTIFDAYTIGDNHYVDLDHTYSPLAAIELALHCVKIQPRGFAFIEEDASMPATQIRLLEMTCGLQNTKAWDHESYSKQGPLAMMRELNHNTAIDQRRIDKETMKIRFGAANIMTIGAEVTHLNAETTDAPSNSPFNGNKSNLEKIEALARKHIPSQREAIMRYAETVTETRAREESITDPTAAFGIANDNTRTDVATYNAKAAESSWLNGLGRRLFRLTR